MSKGLIVMPIELGFATLNESTIIVSVLSFFVLAFYWEIKRLRKNLMHRHLQQELHEVKSSAQPFHGHKLHYMHQSGSVRTRPVVMAAMQEAKTEILEHFAKKRFRDPNEGKQITAS